MNNKTKGIIAVLILLIIAVIVFLCCTYAKQLLGTSNNNNTVQEINEITNTVENKVNEVQNTITENVIENKVEEPKEEPEEVPQEENSEVQDGNYEQKAIEIVKKDMGNTDGLSFQVEDNGNGSYDVCVRDDSSRAIAWYTVWPKTGKFTK